MTARTIIVDSPERQTYCVRIIGKLPLDHAWDVTIERHIAHRTLPQNARLWLLHTAASEVTGYTPAEMHEEALCAHFGYVERACKNPWTGEVEQKKKPLKRSSARNKKEFADFMTATEAFYIETLGVFLGSQ